MPVLGCWIVAWTGSRPSGRPLPLPHHCCQRRLRCPRSGCCCCLQLLVHAARLPRWARGSRTCPPCHHQKRRRRRVRASPLRLRSSVVEILCCSHRDLRSCGCWPLGGPNALMRTFRREAVQVPAPGKTNPPPDAPAYPMRRSCHYSPHHRRRQRRQHLATTAAVG